MKTISTIKHKRSKETPDFSKDNLVMGSTGNVVLISESTAISSKFSGSIVYAADNAFSLGYHSDAWTKKAFTQFHGEVILKR